MHWRNQTLHESKTGRRKSAGRIPVRGQGNATSGEENQHRAHSSRGHRIGLATRLRRRKKGNANHRRRHRKSTTGNEIWRWRKTPARGNIWPAPGCAREGATPKEMSSTETPPVAWLTDKAGQNDDTHGGKRKSNGNTSRIHAKTRTELKTRPGRTLQIEKPKLRKTAGTNSTKTSQI
jgi:hypothetical protein